MRQVVISELARADLLNIGEYLAQHNPDAAIRLMKRFREKFNLLVRFPHLGRERNDILLGLRCLIVNKYLIFYQSSDDIIEIWRVRHSAQSPKDLFDV
jgi:toxin ParE1/3/4